MPVLPPPLRRLVASGASLALGIRFYQLVTSAHSNAREQVFYAATVAIPVVAAGLIWSSKLPAQLLARGAWWSMLLAATLLAMTSGSELGHVGGFTALMSALALLAAGRTGLDRADRFAPAAFRGTLLVSLVLAMADTGAFAWFGTGNAMFDHSWSVLMMLPPMLAGVIGLLQLRTWGLIVSLTTNLAIAILAKAHVLDLVSPLRELFIGSALLQMLVPLPMIVAIVRGRAPSPDAWRRVKRIAPIVVIAVVASAATLAVYAGYLHHGRLLRI
jgi:hypothetical protein